METKKKAKFRVIVKDIATNKSHTKTIYESSDESSEGKTKMNATELFKSIVGHIEKL